MHHHTERLFVDEFRWVSPHQYLKNGWQTLFFFGACCKRGRHLYTNTAPSCCIPASYCHLSPTLQSMSIIVVNLQNNRAVFRIFIALLKLSFDSPSYFTTELVKSRTDQILQQSCCAEGRHSGISPSDSSCCCYPVRTLCKWRDICSTLYWHFLSVKSSSRAGCQNTRTWLLLLLSVHE